MKKLLQFILAILISSYIHAQEFSRLELSTVVAKPWEITYGPDEYLWITEFGGQVSRIDPSNGEKTVVYTAPDYYNGSSLENSPLCPNLVIGSGTLGLALHPDFSDPSTSFIYFVYSYNSGTDQEPATKFRIKRLHWDANSNSVISDINIVNLITTGWDHFGGRLLAVKQDNMPYLFLTVGDNGRSELSSPECYDPQSTNPNNFAQDVTTQNGKIHRFNMDGTIPSDNPISGNSFYTRGHRNPQGLMYNPNSQTIYAVEHGDNTDDEINILLKGMNYGWKDVRGYHDDDSFPGEAIYVENYIPHPQVENDALVEPIYSWCTIPDTTGTWPDWCTVAPSGGAYYGSNTIPEWTNSLLVVTLKDGATTDKEVYQFKLQDNGELVPSTTQDPNPKKFFGADQLLNGRLRDIAISTDGKKIYLVTNEWGGTDKIIVYETLNPVSTETAIDLDITLFPNPTTNRLTLNGLKNPLDVKSIRATSVYGKSYPLLLEDNNTIDVSMFSNGIYFIHFIHEERRYTFKFIKV